MPKGLQGFQKGHPNIYGFQKGHKVNIGKHWKMSDLGKKNISISLQGRKVSEITKNKLRNRMIGNKYTLGHKLSQIHKNKINMNKITFNYEFIEKMEDVRKHIQECEGRHTQQAIKKCEGKHTQTVAFSTFHDALTQVCFGCYKIRSTIKR